ncbi:hypothetical protein [Argonema galeatum]|uniref:hypothetical protein n=1 Tax=Argonema galeatum TaxID=2942762 RepID=UPI002012BCBB|nr:hypothetical protein [Argonema galeatum]MCL1466471.1 hypothetical protein [Argonema galeatum A003/A1]
MISDPLLLQLPTLLETAQPGLFSIEDLRDLDRTLESLENDPSANADDILRNWCMARRSIRDELIIKSSDRKEVGQGKPSDSEQSSRTKNFFQELRQQVQDKLKNQSK